MRALLDTHIWVWWLTGDPALTARERTALDGAANAAAAGRLDRGAGPAVLIVPAAEEAHIARATAEVIARGI